MWLFLTLWGLLLVFVYASQYSFGIGAWVEKRLPIGSFLHEHLARYPAPKNLNIWYAFGALAMVSAVFQYLSGIWLVMYYTPTAEDAFASVQSIMRDVPFGWLIRYIHGVGASMWFLVIYMHIFRALLYGSYKEPRELLWLSGIVLFFLLMAEAYTGYVLPWGQMSYWASKVIISLFETVPFVGKDIVITLQGDYDVSTVTLHRFFAFHVVGFSFLLLGMIALHIVLLHVAGSNNPDGIDIMKYKDKNGWPRDAIGYYPYFVMKYIPIVLVYILLFMVLVFYFPMAMGLTFEAENFREANALITPQHIKPAWYLSPFYAIVRAVPNKSLGALMMLLSIILWAFIPWLDQNPVRSMRFRSFWERFLLAMVVASFIVLGIVGFLPATDTTIGIARWALVFYFLYFLLLPIVSTFAPRYEVPKRVSL
ncbi:MAG: cytochrome b N-terminal domain-containing protein [Pseudomonadota bacterium]|nr:cytochrome b N-terminal domain-containing protein [Pseudomonadota bacterium]MEC8977476.1 cytochrome b N-terminal domain-containing protein [Pseudomonadota bacterium]